MCFTSPELRSASSYGHFTAAKEFRSQCRILRAWTRVNRFKHIYIYIYIYLKTTNDFCLKGLSIYAKTTIIFVLIVKTYENPPTPPGSTGCESLAGRLPLIPFISGILTSRPPGEGGGFLNWAAAFGCQFP